VERKFEWRSSNGQDYLYAQGQSRHDLGYAIGQGLHRQISAARRLYQAALSRNLENSARELLNQAIAGYQSAIPPQDMEEIMGMRKGYSAASGEEMELDELTLQSFGIDLTHQIESRGLGTSLTGCTNFACINADGSTTHGQNYDSDPKLTIADAFVTQAETILISSLQKIEAARQKSHFYLPKIFIRIRRPEQIVHLYQKAGNARGLITGFIAPKFSPENAGRYIDEIVNLNQTAASPVSLMPVLESPSLIDLRTRCDMLYSIKDKIAPAAELIPNIRVGGNDLCHAFGLRRQKTQAIQEILS